MNDWFDNNKPEDENTKNAENASGSATPPPMKRDPWDTGSDDTWKAPAWSSDFKSGDYHKNADSSPAGSENKIPDSEPSPEPTAANPGSVTYRYGINAPDPVPAPREPDPVPPPYSPPQTPPPSYIPPQGSEYGNSYGTGGYNWQRQQTPPYQPPQPPAPEPPKRKKGTTILIGVLSVLCAVSIISASVLFALQLGDFGNNTPSPSTSGNNSQSVNKDAPTLQATPDPDDSIGYTTSDIIEMNLDSTVIINSYVNSSNQNIYGFPNTSGNTQTQVSSASGIIWKSDGYIITNSHVVTNDSTGKPYDRVDVVLYDGTVHENVKIVGADRFTDLAVLKIDGVKGLSEAEFGKSSDLKLGDRVVALGNAGGLSWTATKGIVSGLARDVYQNASFAIKCLQIDAAINPGNSGGPLFNAHGKVVGINSAKIVAEGYEGIGFSIPIDDATAIVNDLAKYGFVKNRVMLGIEGIFEESLYAFRITAISESSCLVGTEVKVGDYITHFNGKALSSYSVLRDGLAKSKVGDTIELTLIRVDRLGGTRTYTARCKLKEATG